MSVIGRISDYEPTKWTEEEKKRNSHTKKDYMYATLLLIGIIVILTIII